MSRGVLLYWLFTESSQLIWSNEECELVDTEGDTISCRCSVLAGFFAVLTEPKVVGYTHDNLIYHEW